ncbi:hypothetical protein, unknown function [Leishmania tarentolae]|uniref:HECT domain-containing protein n=1 Tax=Leishmania tarentolae TaxID=5689 RepID=A0A640KCD6_LEITA|nr:hypothetical protein, unknown function [Leishmania tarentolae]
MGNAQARDRGRGENGVRNNKEPALPKLTTPNPLCYPSSTVNDTTSPLSTPRLQAQVPRTSFTQSPQPCKAPEEAETPKKHPPAPLKNGKDPEGRGGDGDKSRRRVWTPVEDAKDAPHRHPIFFSLNALTPSQSVDEPLLILSRSSATAQRRLMASKARDILRGILFPRQGELECVLSGFLTHEDYARMRSFWAPFLTTQLKDKWYLDAVMLSVLDKCRWSSWGQPKQVASGSLGRVEVQQWNRRRQESYDELQKRLLELSGVLMEKGERRGNKKNQEAPPRHSDRHSVTVGKVSATESKGVPCNSKNGKHSSADGRLLSSIGNGKAGRLCVDGTAMSARQQKPLSVFLTRLQSAASISLDCLDLIAGRIPTALISSVPHQYFSSTIPVVYEKVAYQEKKVGDLDALSFFVSIESRVKLLNGRLPVDVDLHETTNMKHNKNAAPSGSATLTHKDKEGQIQTAQQLYSAVRHAGLVFTTACSSMVLTVLFHLADVLRERQAFRDKKAKAAELVITLEQLMSCDTAPRPNSSDKKVEKLDELKRDVITGRVSLTVLVKELLMRFRSDIRARRETLQKSYPNLFSFLETVATSEEQRDLDVTRLLGGTALKLMFLTGGGQRSIAADDRRVPSGVSRTTDDVALCAMLEIPILNLICWIGCMMGMPIMSSHSVLAQQYQSKPLSFIDIDECCDVMCMLFQAVGALPCRSACPNNIKEWLPLFPFYAVNSEGKRALMYLYTSQVTAVQRMPLMLQKDMTLPSFAAAFRRAEGQGRSGLSNYYFEPNFTVGYAHGHTDSDAGIAGKDTTQQSGTPQELLLTPSGSSDASWSDTTVFKRMRAHSDTPSPTAATDRSCPGERRSPSTSSDASSSCSTLMEENLNIDVYTCVNPQMQLYLRCSNEATMRRHHVTELTPSVSATFYRSTRDIEAGRPDIAPVLCQAVPKLLPSEGFLTLRWTSGEPLVTFCVGDLVSVMAERLAMSAAGDGAAAEMSSSSQQQLSNTSSAYCFRGVSPYLVDGIDTLDALIGGKGGSTRSTDNNHSSAATASVRGHPATIDDPEKRSSGTVFSLQSNIDAYSTALGNDCMTVSSGSCVGLETAHTYQSVMHDVLRLHEKCNRRIGVQWKVLKVLPCSLLAKQSLRVCSGFPWSSAAATGKQDETDINNAYYREVVLHVTAPSMPFAVPLRILTIGHERAPMSAFTFVNPGDETVCWSNPILLFSMVNGDGSQGSSKSTHHALVDSRSEVEAYESTLAVAVTGDHHAPNGLLCDTEEALHNIYYSIGVLLGNAITNGVHFTAPIAPLAFLLMKKAIISGDYALENFMWLEPADGNLLSSERLLNSAYEILSMTDHQYVAFLQMRGLDNPGAHIFPIVYSLADEIRDDKALLQQQQQQRKRESRSPASSSKPTHRQRGSQGAKVTLHHPSPDTANDAISVGRMMNVPGTAAYLKLIQSRNRMSRTFDCASCDLRNQSSDDSSLYSFWAGAHAHAQDSTEAHPEQQQKPVKAIKDSDPAQVLNGQNYDLLYRHLPSRRDYISLYLVNDLVWSPAYRDGHGDKNKELWVSMARGFMTSSLAKSPLMTRCCSRVIREVLCIPRKAT